MIVPFVMARKNWPKLKNFIFFAVDATDIEYISYGWEHCQSGQAQDS
jgi:hypothetical protein